MASTNPYPCPAIKLNTGAYMPLVGLGTYLSQAGEVGAAVKFALAAGYRLIDCASVYDNQAEIGKVLQEVFSQGKIRREDIFITSKLNARFMEPKGISAQLEKTLSDLQTTYLDLYLVHQPIPCKITDNGVIPHRNVGWGVQDVWREMEKLYQSGKVKAIGTSNFGTAILNDVLCYSKIPPAVQQIERTPFLVQPKHVEFCRKNGIQITAYGSLGAPGFKPTLNPNAPEIMNHTTVVSLAQKYGKTAAQILIRWSVDTGVATIPKSVKEHRVKENFNVWDFKLSEDDVKVLDKLDCNLRLYNQDWHTVPTFT